MTAPWIRATRAHWQVLLAVALFAAFSLAHTTAFRPVLERYRRAAAESGRVGASLDMANPVPAPSTRVMSLLAANSLATTAAEEQGASGALTAVLLDQVTRLAVRRGLEVLSTEQGLVTQLPGAVVVRARFRLGGDYARFLGLLDDLARARTLVTLDRFSLSAAATRGGNIELSVSQLVLKRTGASR